MTDKTIEALLSKNTDSKPRKRPPPGNRSTGDRSFWVQRRLAAASSDEREKIRGRLLAKTIPAPEGDCVLWRGAATRDGQGICSIYGVLLSVSRALWVLAGNPPLPATKHLARRCGSGQRCVNVAHFASERSIAAKNKGKRVCPAGHANEGENLLVVVKKDGKRERRCIQCLPFPLTAYAVFLGRQMTDVRQDEETGSWIVESVDQDDHEED